MTGDSRCAHAAVVATATSSDSDSNRGGRPFTLLQKAYLYAGTALPFVSCVLYGAVPTGTVEHFGGEPSPASTFWCARTLPTDALYAYTSWWVLRGSGGDDDDVDRQGRLRITVRAHFAYALLHFGRFWWHHHQGPPHPSPGGYPFSILVAAAATVAWGGGVLGRPQPKGINAASSAARRMGEPIVGGLQRAYFAAATAVAAATTLLCATQPLLIAGAFPSGAGDTPAQLDSTKMWCSVQASGDVLVLYLNAWALATSSSSSEPHDGNLTARGRVVRTTALRANVLYAVLNTAMLVAWGGSGNGPAIAAAVAAVATSGMALFAWS